MEYFNSFTKSDITAISSVVIAFLALFLTIWQGLVVKKHNRLSLQPILRFASEVAVSKKGLVFSISNHGVGPAIISSLYYVVKGKRYEIVNINSFSELRVNLGLTDFDFSLLGHPKIKNAVIPAGENTIIFKFANLDGTDLTDSELNKTIVHSLPKFGVDYTCTYGKKYSQEWSWEPVENLV
ncbi:hypothetical protein [Catenovulum adriaticum]|uniref:DUF2393 domain-containing protein n=1 Tax=Catenovulum adriaticum TaxID=2984846 RepID=A0ABY7ASJ2_9ALTE|nr:hypothetical protein [Catenovulum sp. TS8]WAJ72233.1 hypothetical protein OLW01_18330 [Catenovulum sp. TS8]